MKVLTSLALMVLVATTATLARGGGPKPTDDEVRSFLTLFEDTFHNRRALQQLYDDDAVVISSDWLLDGRKDLDALGDIYVICESFTLDDPRVDVLNTNTAFVFSRFTIECKRTDTEDVSGAITMLLSNRTGRWLISHEHMTVWKSE